MAPTAKAHERRRDVRLLFAVVVVHVVGAVAVVFRDLAGVVFVLAAVARLDLGADGVFAARCGRLLEYSNELLGDVVLNIPVLIGDRVNVTVGLRDFPLVPLLLPFIPTGR